MALTLSPPPYTEHPSRPRRTLTTRFAQTIELIPIRPTSALEPSNPGALQEEEVVRQLSSRARGAQTWKERCLSPLRWLWPPYWITRSPWLEDKVRRYGRICHWIVAFLTTFGILTVAAYFLDTIGFFPLHPSGSGGKYDGAATTTPAAHTAAPTAG